MNYNDIWLIVNMDETPAHLDMVSDTTIDFIGAENTSIETEGREKYLFWQYTRMDGNFGSSQRRKWKNYRK